MFDPLGYRFTIFRGFFLYFIFFFSFCLGAHKFLFCSEMLLSDHFGECLRTSMKHLVLTFLVWFLRKEREIFLVTINFWANWDFVFMYHVFAKWHWKTHSRICEWSNTPCLKCLYHIYASKTNISYKTTQIS